MRHVKNSFVELATVRDVLVDRDQILEIAGIIAYREPGGHDGSRAVCRRMHRELRADRPLVEIHRLAIVIGDDFGVCPRHDFVDSLADHVFARCAAEGFECAIYELNPQGLGVLDDNR